MKTVLRTLSVVAAVSSAAIFTSGTASLAEVNGEIGDQRTCTRNAATAIAQQVLSKAGIAADGPGVTLAIYAPLRWKAPLTTAIGWADLAQKTPVVEKSKMLAGSVGKTLYAAAALNLADAGRLDLDRTVAHYLPEASIPNAGIVTVRQLLSHTSGYSEYDGQFIQDLVADPLRPRQLADWVGPLKRGKLSAPGTYRYTDINFVLLAKVLDTVVKGRAEDFIVAQLLKPYGLNDTVPSDRPDLQGLIAGYAGPQNFFGRDEMLRNGKLIYNPQFESGGGGFITTAPDLSRWIALFALGNFFSQASWQDASRPRHIDSKTGRGYGLGIHINQTPVGTAYGHSGYIPGYYSWARWYPDANVSVAIQVNSSDDARVPWDGFDIADDIAGQIDALCNR